MATFEVHTDKENVSATPFSRKSTKGLSSSAKPLGSWNQNKFPSGLTFRQALKNVNQQGAPKGVEFAKPKPVPSLRPADAENLPGNGFSKNIQGKKNTKNNVGLSVRKQNRSKLAEQKAVVEMEPVPQIDIPNDDEYDSDSIFPRSERLSSYVGKLLTWRPPCIFGSNPDSDLDISDPEDNFMPDEEILELPTCLEELPDFIAPQDITELPVDVPSLNLKDVGLEHDGDFSLSRLPSPEPLSDLSFNVSLPLGTLEMIQKGAADSELDESADDSN